MSEFSPAEIVAYRFTPGRRKGYDTLQVDGYLTRLADHVARMEAELTRLRTTERAALEVLQQAQVIAAETVAAAERDADILRQNAKDGLENARRDASATLDAARVEADKTLLAARVQAEAAAEHHQLQISELEKARAARTNELEQIDEELTESATQSARELRSVGQRLVEMAEHFEFRLATGGEVIDAPDDGSLADKPSGDRVNGDKPSGDGVNGDGVNGDGVNGDGVNGDGAVDVGGTRTEAN